MRSAMFGAARGRPAARTPAAEAGGRRLNASASAFAKRCLTEPEAVKQELLAALREYLGGDYDVDTHFTPRYRPWQQRLAFVPDGDMFRAIAEGRASVVTDEIEHFTDRGILLKSGILLDADIVITATGFNLCVLGDVDFTIDGEPLVFGDTLTYRGMMFTGVPNLAWVFGYFRAELDAARRPGGRFRLPPAQPHAGARCETRRRGPAPRGPRHAAPALDRPGQLQSRLHDARHAPAARRGDRPEWAHTQDYWAEKDVFPAINLEDDVFIYSPS